LEEHEIDIQALPECKQSQDTLTEEPLDHAAFMKFQASLFPSNAAEQTETETEAENETLTEDDQMSGNSACEDPILQQNTAIALDDELVAQYSPDTDLAAELYPMSFHRHLPPTVVKALYYAM
jgi:hypothetical protein